MVSARELVELRLIAQRLVGEPLPTVREAAAHLSASQGQHLHGVLASLAQRTVGGTWLGVAAAFGRGEVVRGYPMRGTVFAVAADDLAWQTALTGQRQLDGARRRRIEHGLDALVPEAIDVARATIAAELEGGVSRQVLGEAWEAAGIPTDAGRLYHLVFTLMASGELAYGPITSAGQLLVDARAWLPADSTLEARFNGDERAALAHWLRSYLVSHGPATVREFAWWTKLPLGRIRAAAAEATAELEAYGEAGGETRWGRPGLWDDREALGVKELDRGRLLAPFDELVLGYPDRTYLVPAQHEEKLAPGHNGVFKNALLRRGEIVGTWKTKARAAGPELVLEPFGAALPKAAQAELARAFAKYPHPDRDAAGE